MAMDDLRAAILGYKQTIPTMTVPELGDIEIGCGVLNSTDFFQLIEESKEAGDAKLNILNIVACAVDPETGEKLFTADDADVLQTVLPFFVARDISDWICDQTRPQKAEAEKN